MGFLALLTLEHIYAIMDSLPSRKNLIVSPVIAPQRTVLFQRKATKEVLSEYLPQVGGCHGLPPSDLDSYASGGHSLGVCLPPWVVQANQYCRFHDHNRFATIVAWVPAYCTRKDASCEMRFKHDIQRVVHLPLPEEVRHQGSSDDHRRATRCDVDHLNSPMNPRTKTPCGLSLLGVLIFL